MESFNDVCCDKCTHSAVSPCPDFVDCRQNGPSCHDDAACRAAVLGVREKNQWENTQVPMLVLGMGTCGVAAGAQKVRESLVAELDKQGVKTRMQW